MNKLLTCAFLLMSLTTNSQLADTTKNEKWKSIYRAAETRINDLVHTKLDVRFDYHKAYMYGEAWITLHPHFYLTDSLNLDAKGMNINEVSIVKGGKRVPLKYSYDSMNLRIILDKSYKADENYTVFINYVSKPNENSAANLTPLAGSRGLYFINPRGEEKDKPIQIWTQGETEFNSRWFPTIDKPNQKTTEEISMTVPEKYVTLSNGLLASQKKNNDGTRTDTWKMNLPHAPYLFFMGVGDYAIIKDEYKGKEVSYYVEREYAPVARKIFGLTPEMIAFYSKITGIDFPWQKYSQITGQDYEGGAMENTTATFHHNFAQQDRRELSHQNIWEGTIAHELFHQWFGDYVTAESWSNLTLNESFADYSESLWYEYKYGKDRAQEANFNGLMDYLGSPVDTGKNLVRFYYNDKEDVFDNVSYPKGGRILHMLRMYVGDSAFFKSLHLYLTVNKFKAAEAQHLRLAFEEVTGEDMNWFWNQWYYNSGHPKLDINYGYDSANKKADVFIRQTQYGKIFKLPVAIDVYGEGEKSHYKVWITHSSDTFSFPVSTRPRLINVDAEKMLICEKTDNKKLEDFIYQYEHAGSYTDRREAVEFAAKNQNELAALNFLKNALDDRFDRLRAFTISQLNLKNDTVRRFMESSIVNKATNDISRSVKASAITALGEYKKAEYKAIFLSAIKDSSYHVAGAALESLAKIDSIAALHQVEILSLQPAKGPLMGALISLSNESRFDSLTSKLDLMSFGIAKFRMIKPFANFLSKVKNTSKLMKGVDIVVKFRNSMPQQYRSWSDAYFDGILAAMAETKQSSGLKEQADYIKAKLPLKVK